MNRDECPNCNDIIPASHCEHVRKSAHTPCEECGNPKTEAHHENYIKQLVVRWLCRLHHRLTHAQAKGEK